jgi:terminase small subunit-like protein
MATKKSDKPPKNLSSRQHAFLKAYAKGKTLKQAAIEAGYSKKNADQSGYQALKAIKGRAADLMDEIGLTDQFLIENYLVPLLEAKETKFFNEGKRRINAAALGIRHTALDTAFKLRGSYAPRDPAEAAQFGIKVVVVDIPRPPRNTIDVTPPGAGGNGKPPSDNNGHD